MISVSEAKALITNHIIPLEPVSINLEKAAGLVLASDIYAGLDLPPFKQSAMDGYAIRYQDKEQPLRLTGEMAAGTAHTFNLNHGETCRVFTGAPLPEGADSVVMQEKIILQDDTVMIRDQDLKVGSNVREKGSEIRSGELAIRKGNLLTPAAIGFLASLGITKVDVIPRPRISIVVTGNELRKPGLELSFGQVYEANSYALSSALKNEGVEDIRAFEADDDVEILTNVIKTALEDTDVLLLAGGVSVGDYDFVIEASQRCGIQQVFHKVKQRPGKPLFFGTWNKTLIFGLPGNPSSVLSCYYNYVLPSLKQMSGKQNPVKEVKAELADSYKKPAGLTHFLKGIYEDGKATPLSAQESFRLSSFAYANCLICLDEEREDFSAGDSVTIMLLPN